MAVCKTGKDSQDVQIGVEIMKFSDSSRLNKLEFMATLNNSHVTSEVKS